MTDTIPAEVLTPAEVAELLKVNVQTVYDLCDELTPELGHYRIGRKILIPRTDLDAYLGRAYRPALVIEESRFRPVQPA
jgi:excisionase family DNA binding protein